MCLALERVNWQLHWYLHLLEGVRPFRVNILMFKQSKNLKSLDIAWLPLELKEVLWIFKWCTYCYEDGSKWTKTKWRRYGFGSSVWFDTISVQFDAINVQFGMVNVSSLRSLRVWLAFFLSSKRIVKLKLVHPYLFRSIKIDLTWEKHGVSSKGRIMHFFQIFCSLTMFIYFLHCCCSMLFSKFKRVF